MASSWRRRYALRLTVPRIGGWRARGAVRADFERACQARQLQLDA